MDDFMSLNTDVCYNSLITMIHIMSGGIFKQFCSISIVSPHTEHRSILQKLGTVSRHLNGILNREIQWDIGSVGIGEHKPRPLDLWTLSQGGYGSWAMITVTE